MAITVHNYRWRLGLAQGETRCDELESKFARFPPIEVPTITLERDANGAPHVESGAYAKMFSGRYEHRLITGGIGHNLPQECRSNLTQAAGRMTGRTLQSDPAMRSRSLDQL